MFGFQWSGNELQRTRMWTQNIFFCICIFCNTWTAFILKYQWIWTIKNKKNTNELGPAWHIAGNHRIREQKKITFSHSDPGGTLENKLNDLKPLFSRKKSLTFQKRSKKMFLHWRANLADQNKQQPLKINIRVTYHTVLSVWNKPLIDKCQHCSTSRANQALCSLANAGFQNRGVCLQAFSFLPLPLPSLSFFGSCFISRAAKTENPVPQSYFALKPNGNACYAG